EWLEQVLESVPVEHHAAVLGTMFSQVDELRAVQGAVTSVCAIGADPALAPLFAPRTPLYMHLVDVCAWIRTRCQSLEEIATGLRRGKPVRSIFLARTINASHANLDGQTPAIRDHVLDVACHAGSKVVAPLDVALEELFWATSWLHLSLTKNFGE